MNINKKKFSGIIIAILILTMLIPELAYADNVPYVTYNFDYWDNVVYTPAAYVPDGSISGESLGLSHKIGEVHDFYVDPDSDLIAISDKMCNSIYIVDATSYKLLYELKDFFNTETGEYDNFLDPLGVCISEVSKVAAGGEEGEEEVTEHLRQLFVCDQSHTRIVYFDVIGEKDSLEIEYAGHIDNTMFNSEILGEGYIFKPIRVCVDSADKLYVINQDEFQGILQLEKDGSFNGYFGTINVNVSLWQKIWKTLSTQEQKKKQTLFIPTEYTGIDIDDKGFLFASYTDTTGTQAVMRLNSKGGDVIRKGANQNLSGDVMKVASTANMYSGFSKIIDVCYNSKGMYSMIDKTRGRIFTYDTEGNLLYIYGGVGSLDGTFTSARSIESNKEQRLVCDVTKNEIQIFSPTQYGSLINEAVSYRYDGDEAMAVATWQKVLQLNENFEQAYIGIGKAYLNSGEYKKAMDYLSLGMSRSYYSIAYKRYRNNVIKSHFNLIFGVILVLLVAFIVTRLIKKSKAGKYDD